MKCFPHTAIKMGPLRRWKNVDKLCESQPWLLPHVLWTGRKNWPMKHWDRHVDCLYYHCITASLYHWGPWSLWRLPKSPVLVKEIGRTILGVQLSHTKFLLTTISFIVHIFETFHDGQKYCHIWPYDTQSLPGPVLTNHHWGSMPIAWGRLNKRYPSHRLLKSAWNLLI